MFLFANKLLRFCFPGYINGLNRVLLLNSNFSLYFIRILLITYVLFFNYTQTPSSSWPISLPILQHLSGESLSTMTITCRTISVFPPYMFVFKIQSAFTYISFTCCLPEAHEFSRASMTLVCEIPIFAEQLNEAFSPSAVTDMKEIWLWLEALTYKDTLWHQWLPSQVSSYVA